MKKKYLSPLITTIVDSQDLLDSFGIGSQGKKDEFSGAKNSTTDFSEWDEEDDVSAEE